MILESVLNSIAEWAKKRDRDKSDTLILLAIDYIKKNGTNWNSITGKSAVVSHVEELYYGISRNTVSFKDDFKGHQPDENPFEINIENIRIDNEARIGHQDLNTDEGSTIFDDQNSGNTNQRPDADSLPFPNEVKELLKEFEDKSYKSLLLTNLNLHARLKLIRKAKILIYLQKQAGKI
jgi:hypothetical protein